MITQIFAETVERHGQRTAVACADIRMTWDDVGRQVAGLSARLADSEIGLGDRVAIWLSNSPAFVVSYLAVLSRGAVVVPLNPASRSGDVPITARDLAAVITSEDSEPQCRRALGQSAVLRYINYLDGNSLQECQTPRLDIRTFERVAAATSALLHHSSGATGRPKLLVRSHGQCAAEIQHFRTTCGVTEEDVIFCALPLFHAHGMANALWAAIGSGASLVVMKDPQPFRLQWSRALSLLESESATIFPGVPLMFESLADAPRSGNLTKLRLCFSAGVGLPQNVFDRFLEKFGVPIRQLYGCTEAGSVTINLDSDPTVSSHTVGRPMSGVEVQVWNDHHESVLAGDTGEVAIRSPALTSGYIDADETNARCFRDGWFLTGDMGRLDAAGRLEVIGRKQFVISVSGHKVYAQEVEDVLASHPSVAEAAVVGVANARSGEAISAFIVPRGVVREEELHDHCRSQLPPFKRPQRITFVAALPRTALGKVARAQLGGAWGGR